jgi:hypothetical protein
MSTQSVTVDLLLNAVSVCPLRQHAITHRLLNARAAFSNCSTLISYVAELVRKQKGRGVSFSFGDSTGKGLIEKEF